MHVKARLERAETVFTPAKGCQRDRRNPLSLESLFRFQRSHLLQHGAMSYSDRLGQAL